MKTAIVSQIISASQETALRKQARRSVQALNPDNLWNALVDGMVQSERLIGSFAFYNIMVKVPAVINKTPIRILGVIGSWRIKKARITVITMLNLSTGTTLEASPICKAL